MLTGISPLIGPDLLAAMHRMGHGDELVLADAHFPGHSLGPPVIRADGLLVADLLDAILPLLALDAYEPPLWMMDAVPGDTLDPAVDARYRAAVDRHQPEADAIRRLERFAFYERAKAAALIVITGDTATYGNLILKKGVTQPTPPRP